MSANAEAEQERPKPEPEITITVDGEALVVHEKRLTPNQIMEKAHIDPVNHYLVELKKHHQESFQGQGDTPIHLKDGLAFVANSTGPTPVS